MEKFTKHDWDHMYGCILHATWNTTKKKCVKDELVELFNKLPEELKEDAYEFGMSDTLWRDNFIEWYVENYIETPKLMETKKIMLDLKQFKSLIRG